MLLRILRKLLRRRPAKPRRARRPGERKGDETLYPTDRYTEDMQPKK